jgi:hypothetical protein
VALAHARTQAGECGSDYLTDVTVVGERAVSAVRRTVLSDRTSQHSLNLHRLPAAAARRRNAALVQRLRDSGRAGNPLRPDGLDDWQEVGGSGCRLRPPSLRCFLSPQLDVLEVLHPTAEFDATRLRRSSASLVRSEIFHTVNGEQGLGLAILAVVSVLGSGPPAIHGGQ